MNFLDIAFWSVYLILPLVVYLLLRVAGEKVNRITIVTVVSAALYVFSVVGTLPLFYKWDAYRVAIGVVNQDLIFSVLLYSSVNMVFFLIGVIFLRQVTGWKPVPIISSGIRDFTWIQKVGVAFVFILCIVTLVVYIQKINKIAFFVALTDGVERAAAARSAMGNDFQGKYHWYKLLMYDVGAMLLFSIYAAWVTRRGYARFLALLVIFFYAAFVAVMATEKAPMIWLLMGIFMTHFLATNNGNVPLSKIVFLGGAVIGVLVVFYLYFSGADDLQSAVMLIFSRAFSGSIMPAYFYLEYFPSHQDYLMGQTMPNPGGIFPYTPARFTVDIMNWKFPYLAEKGIVGSMPTVFWGEAYANFGVPAIPIVSFLVGIQVAVVTFLVSKVGQSPLSLGFLVWLILHFMNLSVTGFSEYIFNFYAIGVGGVSMLLWISCGKIFIRKRRYQA